MEIAWFLYMCWTICIEMGYSLYTSSAEKVNRAMLRSLESLSPAIFETPAILKKVATAGRNLAELKGLAVSIPNQEILINALGMQEAKDSSAIENIITTHDELYKDAAFPESMANPNAKEVVRYRQALRAGFDAVRQNGLITVNHILEIQAEIEQNSAGFRKLPGTALKDSAGNTVYTPPQDHAEIVALMSDLERFINVDALYDADPLIKMALAHHQFESIHPFYDGNGRTGRIINVLYLVRCGLLDSPVLYMSRYIVRNKGAYYLLLQAARDSGAWEDWVIYMLEAVEHSSADAVTTINAIKHALAHVKHQVRAGFKFFSQDLINNLFNHPYTKIEYLARDLNVSRLTATKYLESLTKAGVLTQHRLGRSNYYINVALNSILAGEENG
jgi:Fic family protein